MGDKAQILAEHYQKTFEHIYEIQKDRNKVFVWLLVVLGAGLILALHVPETNLFLVDAIAKVLGIGSKERIEQLYNTFPFSILLSALLMVASYLMQRLYSTNLSVMRNYQYLEAIEEELRESLKLPSTSISFTREGKFFQNKRPFLQSSSKWYFIVVIFIAFLPFIILKSIDNCITKNAILIITDSLFAIITSLYYIGYVKIAFALDSAKHTSSIHNQSNKQG